MADEESESFLKEPKNEFCSAEDVSQARCSLRHRVSHSEPDMQALRALTEAQAFTIEEMHQDRQRREALLTHQLVLIAELNGSIVAKDLALRDKEEILDATMTAHQDLLDDRDAELYRLLALIAKKDDELQKKRFILLGESAIFSSAACACILYTYSLHRLCPSSGN
jgi:hypothetical protein